jgi:hypothetical protein
MDDGCTHSMAGQAILAIAYGIEVRPHGDPYVAIAEKAIHAMSLATRMGGGLFDLVPWCGSPTLDPRGYV